MKKYLLSFFFVSFFFSCVSPAFAAITGLNDIAYSLLFGSRRDGDSEDNLYNKDADAICRSQGGFRVKPDPNLSCKSGTFTVKIKETGEDGNETTSDGTAKANCYYDCICDTSKFPYKEANVKDNIYFKVADGAEECKDPNDNAIYVSDIECDTDNATASISKYDDFFNTTESGVTFEGTSKSKTCYAFDKFECHADDNEVNVDKLYDPVYGNKMTNTNLTKGEFSIDDDTPMVVYNVAFTHPYDGYSAYNGKACVYNAKLAEKVKLVTRHGMQMNIRAVDNPGFIGTAKKECAAAVNGKEAKYFPSFIYSYYNGDCMTNLEGCTTEDPDTQDVSAEDFYYYNDDSGLGSGVCFKNTSCKIETADGAKVCGITSSWGEWMDTVTHTGAGCQALLTCDELGYIFTAAQCEQYGLDYIHCPIDSTKVYCSIVKVPDNCTVGMIYNTSNNTCYEGTSGRIVTNVEEKNGLKHITTVNVGDPREVLKDAAIEVDSGAFPVLNINTSTIQNGVELRIAAENFCYNGGYDKGLPSGKDMVEVYKKVGELGKYYGNGGTKCKEVGCDYMFLTSEGYVYGDVPVTEDNITSEKYQRNVNNYMMLCKKTYPMRIYEKGKCAAMGYKSVNPDGQTCDVVVVGDVQCFDNCHTTSCTDIKGNDGAAGVSEEPEDKVCKKKSKDGVTCYVDCKTPSCSAYDNSLTDKKPSGKACTALNNTVTKCISASGNEVIFEGTPTNQEGLDYCQQSLRWQKLDADHVCYKDCVTASCDIYDGYLSEEPAGQMCKKVQNAFVTTGNTGLGSASAELRFPDLDMNATCFDKSTCGSCENIGDNYYSEEQDGYICSEEVPEGYSSSCYKCSPICATGMYYDGVSQYCIETPSKYLVLSVSNITSESMDLKLFPMEQEASSATDTTLGAAVSTLKSIIRTPLSLDEYEFIKEKDNRYFTCYYAADGLFIGNVGHTGDYTNSTVKASDCNSGSDYVSSLKSCVSAASATNDMMQVYYNSYVTHTLAVCGVNQTFKNNVCYNICRIGMYFDGEVCDTEHSDDFKYYVTATYSVTGGKKYDVINIASVGNPQSGLSVVSDGGTLDDAINSLKSKCSGKAFPTETQYKEAYVHASSYDASKCYLTNKGTVIKGGNVLASPDSTECNTNQDTDFLQINGWCTSITSKIVCDEGYYFNGSECKSAVSNYDSIK